MEIYIAIFDVGSRAEHEYVVKIELAIFLDAVCFIKPVFLLLFGIDR